MYFQSNGERHNIFVASAFVGAVPSAVYFTIAMAIYSTADFVLTACVFIVTTMCVVGIIYLDMIATVIVENSARRHKLRSERGEYYAQQDEDVAEGDCPDAGDADETAPKPMFIETTIKIDGEDKIWNRPQDPADRAWRKCCVSTLLWAHHYGGLSVACLVGNRIFKTPGQWGRAMEGLEAGGIVERKNGVGTFVTSGWTYGRAINFINSGGSIPWPQGFPPEISPYTGDKSPRPANLETVAEMATAE